MEYTIPSQKLSRFYISILLCYFSNHYSFDIFQRNLQTSKQGVYLIVLFNDKWGPKPYVGSSYGATGLQHRVYNNHFKEAYRVKDFKKSGKKLYEQWMQPGTIAKCACLAVFEDQQPFSVVLIAEATMTARFGSLDLDTYWHARPGCLPSVDPNWGLNRSCPLRSYSEGHNLYTVSWQEVVLDNALAEGP